MIRLFFKLIKWVLYIFLALILLLILAAVLITNLINPNDYKNKIEKVKLMFHKVKKPGSKNFDPG